MTDSLALNGMGGYGYGYGYGYDPYFMQALQSYNPNAPKMQGNTPVSQPTPAASSTPLPMTEQKQEEKEGKSNAGLVLGGLATVGASVLLYKAHKKGGDKGIKEGLKQMWKGLSGSSKKSASNKNIVEKFTVRQTEEGTWFAQVPNRRHKVDVTNQEALKELGISNVIPNIADDGVRVRNISFTHNGNTFRVKNGKVVEYRNSAGDDLLGKWNNPTGADAGYKKEVQELIAKINKGDEAALTNVSYIDYVHVNDGVIRKFTKQGTNEPVLSDVITNRYGLNSVEVNAARSRDNVLDGALKAITDNKKPTGMVAHKAKYDIKGQKFYIEDGVIKGMYGADGKIYKPDSDTFLSWKYNNAKKYEQMVKDIQEGKGMYDLIWQAA